MRSCIVLCGGRSQRMGQDKGLMNLNNKPMVIHVLETISQCVDEIVLVLRDDEQLKSYQEVLYNYNLKNQPLRKIKDIKIITDCVKDQGPLYGIFTGLLEIKGNGALVLPCDSPYISSYLINTIFSFVDENKDDKCSATVPQWADGSWEPLHAYYRKTCLQIIENKLNEGFRDVKSLFDRINVNFINAEQLDPEKISFKNLNRPEDINK